MVVALLGVLKAGAAYVPLDPGFPPERLRFMIEDAKLSLLLTEQNLVAELRQHQATLVCLDTDWQEITRATAGRLDPQSDVPGTGADLAYVIYTSVSTG